MTAAILAQQEVVDALAPLLAACMEANTNAQVELRRCEQAAKRLEEIANKGIGQAPPAAVVEKQRANVERATLRLKAWKQRTEADKHAANVAQALYIVDTLKVDGLRLQKQSKALHKFNKDYLQKISALGDWKEIAVDKDMRITYNGRSYLRCSAGEKFRVKFAFQVALAWQEPCALLVIDEGTNELDGDGMSGMIQILEQFPAPSLVALTITKPQDIPPLEEWGCGKVYMMEDGVAKLFSKGKVTA